MTGEKQQELQRKAHLQETLWDAAPGTGHHSFHSAPAEEQGAGREGPDRGLGREPPEIAEDGLAQADGSKRFQEGLLHRVLGAT